MVAVVVVASVMRSIEKMKRPYIRMDSWTCRQAKDKRTADFKSSSVKPAMVRSVNAAFKEGDVQHEFWSVCRCRIRCKWQERIRSTGELG